MATQNRDVSVPMGRRRAAERTKNPVRQWFDALAAWALFSLGMLSGPLQAGWLDDVKASLPGGWGAPPYRVVDSGYWAEYSYSMPNNGLNWVDNDRVIFVGGSRADWERYIKRGSDAYVPYLFSWDTRSNRVVIHSQIARLNIPCFSRGYIRYYLPGGTGDQRVLKSGPFGKETETLVDRKHNTVEVLSLQGLQYSELRCKPFSIAEARISPKRLLVPLLEGHGYLDISADPFIPDEKMEPVRWYRDRKSSPVDLPIIKDETAKSMVSYTEWSNTYIIATERARYYAHNSTGDWPKNVPRPLYLMKPGGEVEQLNLPYVRDLSSARRFYSAKIGIAFLAGRVAVNGPGKAGVYIWTGGDAVHRALPGETAAAALSPDGCKLAVAIDPRDHGGSDRYYLKMIDFCAKGGK